jgi:hypothetical protein
MCVQTYLTHREVSSKKSEEIKEDPLHGLQQVTVYNYSSYTPCTVNISFEFVVFTRIPTVYILCTVCTNYSS